ncbi:MAG: site-specific DNA-methyltransferase [Candidatus Methanofastidiosa archaeon]|nr:site-specific DNA-methyltransferase [Candidatus Methanofastidiosa archaeon]
MKPFFENDLGEIYQGDCLDVMKELPSESIDLLLTDPPYGYSFLGKDWDRAVPKVDIWKECNRLLKPGSFAFIMSAPRLDCLLRMALNLGEAGFEIGFTPIYWAYHSGFPKALDISKVIDRRLGLKRETVEMPGRQRSALCWGKHYACGRREIDFTLPASDEAKSLSGGYAGFQPKPAVEVVIVAMKPLSEKSHTDQALKNGKGVTWLKDCSIPTEDGFSRFPSNLLACDKVFGGDSYMFDLDMWFEERMGSLPKDIADRFPFLFVKKPSKSEKESGCESIGPKRWCDDEESVDIPQKRNRAERHNYHPTVKPVKLMSYLTVLGSRPKDIVLDPFLGSGTTAMACELLGRRWIGIELEREYAEIAAARISNSGLKIRASLGKERPDS